METSTQRDLIKGFFYRWPRWVLGLTALLAAPGLPGCASAPPVGRGVVQNSALPTPAPSAHVETATAFPSPHPAGIMETYGPPQPEVLAPSYGPVQVVLKPVVLVLGPGKARGFAYAGAIRALVQAKIPIGAILGTEMGAFIGALYAASAKINQFEWALLRFKDDSFIDERSLMPSMFQRARKSKKVQAELDRIFGNKDLVASAVPVRFAVLLKNTNAPVVLERGPMALAVRAAIADPELFEPGAWDGSAAVSAAQVRPFLVAEARALNIGPVVVIDALDETEAQIASASSELKDADMVIRPDLSGITPMDFQKRTDAAFRGKKAVESQLAEIRQRVGMAPDAEGLQKGSAP